ncbi:hypothetical protein GCM10010442_12290 [Kitasatospora kifunensis]
MSDHINGGYGQPLQAPAGGNPPQCQTSQPTPPPQIEAPKEQK